MRLAPAPPLALPRRRPGAFALLMAATCLLMLLAAALGLGLQAVAGGAARIGARTLLVQVIDANRTRRDAVADAAMDRLNRTSGLISATRLTDAEARALIATYMDGVDSPDLPLPVLIDVKARDPAAMARAVGALPHVQVTRMEADLRPLLTLVRTLRGTAWAVALVAAGATGLIAVLAARAAIAREAVTLGVLHALGATDRQMSRLICGTIARDAAIGAAAGLLAAMAVISVVGGRLAAVHAGLHVGFGAGSWAVLLMLPVALIGLAAAAAQGALVLALWRAP